MLKKFTYILTLVFLIIISSKSVYAAEQSVLRLIIGGSGGNVKPSQECQNNPQRCLEDEFNFRVQGNPTRAVLLDVYTNFLQVAAVAPRYKQLLRSSGPTPLIFAPPGSVGNCPARVRPLGNGISSLTLEGYSLSGCSDRTRKSRLVHESGHVIRNGHMRLFQEFENKAYRKDANCYKVDGLFSPPYFINTYDTSYARSLRPLPQISGSNESMAEFMALSVIPEGGYPKRCPAGYNWVKDNIFGGKEFN